MLGYLETGKRTTTKVYALLAVSYLRTELQLRITWYFAGLTRDEYDSEKEGEKGTKSALRNFI